MSTQPSDTRVASEPGGSNVVVVKQRGWAGTLLVIIGMLGLLCAGYVGLSIVNLVPDIKNPFRTEVEVVGSAGTIRIPRPFKPGERETIAVVRGDDVLEHVVDAPGLYVRQFEDFGRAARGAPPVVTLADSRANVAALVAVLESARSGKAVRPTA